MRFVGDEHIAPEVLQFLRDRGHMAVSSIDALGLKAGDPEIANWASSQGAIILTSDRWFRDAISRRPGQKRIRYPNAGRILFSGNMTKRQMLSRLSEHIGRIEREFEEHSSHEDGRLIIEITDIRLLIEL